MIIINVKQESKYIKKLINWLIIWNFEFNCLTCINLDNIIQKIVNKLRLWISLSFINRIKN